MLTYFLDFLGISSTDPAYAAVLPVVISVIAALSLYLFICFFQFIRQLLNRK